VERHSRFTILIKVPSKDTATVVAALSRQVRKLPASLSRSLTWDRGLEMAKHKSFTVDTKVQVYFCDPQSPWQRGSNENTNGLLRQYFPKKIDLSGYSQADLDKVALQLNQRHEKLWALKLLLVNSRPVLQRPIETALVIGMFPCIGRSPVEIVSIPVLGNSPSTGGKLHVRQGDYTSMWIGSELNVDASTQGRLPVPNQKVFTSI
jgi:hypothetical protein